MTSRADPTPIGLLTGFLGSGKTTILSRALIHPTFSKTAVIVNEFGEISIDHLVVADLAENIVELRDGCLCCSIRGDLALTLRDIHFKRIMEEIPPFDRVVIETSGLADPIPIIHTLMTNQPLQQVFFLDVVLCVVDAEHGLSSLDAYDEASKQIALADVLLISKVDIVQHSQCAELASKLRHLNSGAEILEVALGEVDPSRLFGRSLFQPNPNDARISAWLSMNDDLNSHVSGYNSHVIQHSTPLSLAGTTVFLNRIVNELSDNILRIKGLAFFRDKGDRPALLHAVQNKFYPVEWLDDFSNTNNTSRLVFIGRDLDIPRIDELFELLCI